MLDAIKDFFINFDFDDLAREFNDFFGTDFTFDFREVYSTYSDFAFFISKNEKTIISSLIVAMFLVLVFFLITKLRESNDSIGEIKYFLTRPMFWFFIGPWSYAFLLKNGAHTSSLGAVFFMIWAVALFLGLGGVILFSVPMGIFCQLVYGKRHRAVFEVPKNA